MGFFSSLTKILDPIAKVGSFIPGPHQPIAAGYSALRGMTSHLPAAAGISSLAKGRGLNREALEAQREALNFARQRNRETAPFRELALRDILGETPEAPRLSGAFVDPTNPFASESPALALSLEALTRNQ